MTDANLTPISADAAKRVIQWLRDNPGERFQPTLFFDRAWIKHKIVVVGERHVEGPQRDFIAERVSHWGGPLNTLALEITADHQEGMDAFLRGERAAPPDGWFARQRRFTKILMAARQARMPIVCMDKKTRRLPLTRPPAKVGAGGPEGDRPAGTGPHLPEPSLSLPMAGGNRNDSRDDVMARALLGTAGLSGRNKALVFVGMGHAKEIREGRSANLGMQLIQSYGKAVYTIIAITALTASGDPFFRAMNRAFPHEKALAFDIDRSPLATETFVDVDRATLYAWRQVADGMMLFF